MTSDSYRATAMIHGVDLFRRRVSDRQTVSGEELRTTSRSDVRGPGGVVSLRLYTFSSNTGNIL